MNTKPKKKKKLQTTEFVTPLSVHFCRLQKVEKKKEFSPREKQKFKPTKKGSFFLKFFRNLRIVPRAE
jgi:hypothetical protein